MVNTRNFLQPCTPFGPPLDVRAILCRTVADPGSGIVDPGPPSIPIAPDFNEVTYVTQTLVNPAPILKKKFTVSLWFRINDSDMDRWDIMHAVDIDNTFWDTTFRITRMDAGNNNKIEISAYDVTGANILNVTSSLGYTLALNPGWHHMVFSADMGKAIVRFYIDRQPVSFTINNFVFNSSIPFEVSDGPTDEMVYEIGGGIYVLGEQYRGCLAEVWLAPGVFFDLDQPVNLQYFISDLLKPTNIGATGFVPLAGSGIPLPLIYLHGSFDVFGTNSGSRGNFTIVGETTACFTNPCVGF
jgi:hypothetical protein